MGNSTVIAVPLPIVKVPVHDPSIKISHCRAFLWIALALYGSVI